MNAGTSIPGQPRRTQDWVNPRLQRALLLLTGVGGLLFVGALLGISHYFESQISVLLASLDQPGVVTASVLADVAQLEWQKWVAQLIFSALFLSFWVAQAFMTSHRIAGPIHKTVLFLKMAPGERPLKLQFREKDFFHELTDAVNDALEKK